MTTLWQPGVQYDYGSVVIYESIEYQVIQPHRSQSDWIPSITPALWGRMQGGGHHHSRQSSSYEKSGQWGGECQPQPSYEQFQQQQQPCRTPSYNQPEQQPYVAPCGPQLTHEESKKKWFEIDDKRKKELEVGGGLLLGVGALTAGYHAYKEHGKNEEEKKAHLWSLNIWLKEAQSRTLEFRSGNFPCQVAWVLNDGKCIPTDAIEGGFERGAPLYICRAYCEGGLMIGKASSVFKKGAVVGYKKEEIHFSKYEILVGNSQAVRWVNVSGQFKLASLGRHRPVEGGREPGGCPQYIAQAPHKGAVHPGKACEEFGDGCYIPYDSTEVKVKEYAVLCYE